ncbi:MAG: M1 family metallopeptidase, partial [Anaerolineae bacterium]
QIALELDARQRQLDGEQLVTYPNRTGAGLDEIVFRLYPNLPQYGGRMEIGPVLVDGQRSNWSLRAEDTSLVVPLSDPLTPEERVTISITFSIEIPAQPTGYVLFGYSQGVWSLPDAYPVLAAHDGSAGLGSPDPGWHEEIAPPYGDAVFAETALYNVSLTVPPTLTVAAAATVISDTQTADGRRIYWLQGGPLREFAWVGSAEYLVTETTVRGTTLRSYYLPGDEGAGQVALTTTAAALRAYADAFGPYPFPELTVVAAPLTFYGMEYPSLNLLGIDLYREHRAELEDRVVHEVAHQWWYAQVGNDQVNAPWLDEGLAEYSMATYYEQVYGRSRANVLINQRWLVPYQAQVENGNDAVVNQPSSAFGPEYEVVVYAKAALFFDAVRKAAGDELFSEILQTYVSRYRWRVASPESFLQVAEEVSGIDLDAQYYHWILTRQ